MMSKNTHKSAKDPGSADGASKSLLLPNNPAPHTANEDGDDELDRDDTLKLSVSRSNADSSIGSLTSTEENFPEYIPNYDDSEEYIDTSFQSDETDMGHLMHKYDTSSPIHSDDEIHHILDDHVVHDERMAPVSTSPPAIATSTPAVTATATKTMATSIQPPPIILNKNIVNNLNKTLKAKQKIINSNDPIPKTPSSIAELINTSPKSSIFPANISQDKDEETSMKLGGNTGISDPTAPATVAKSEKKRKSKAQTTTRADFFAAKLASAVDDVESSDSDETFVYESNNTSSVTNMIDYFSQPVTTTGQDGGSNNATNAQNTPSVYAESIHSNHSINVSNIGLPNPTMNLKLPLAEKSISGTIVNPTSNPSVSTPQQNATTAGATGIVNLGDRDRDNASIHSAATTPLQLATLNSALNAITLNSLDFDRENSTPSNTLKKNPTRSNSIYSIPQLTIPLINEELNRQQDPTHKPSQSPINSHFNPSKLATHSTNHSSISGLHSSIATPTIQGAQPSSHQTGISSVPAELMSLQQQKEAKESNSSAASVHTVGPHNSHNSNNSLHRAASINNESINEIYDVNDLSDDSINDDFYSSTRSNKINSSHTTNTNAGSTNNLHNITKKKSYKTGSKLRSTTSKLFDKKGSQPRRYSIIPDNIDIEDFDDELIYYDNQLQSEPNSNNTNEFSPLLANHPSFAYYRSLNSNNPQQKQSKRFPSSTNYQKNDLFPFPHNQNSFYDDFDENHELVENLGGKGGTPVSLRKSNFTFSGNPKHFLLPRKRYANGFNGQSFTNCFYTLITVFLLISIGFISGFLLVTTKELSGLAVLSVDDIIVSTDELAFSIFVEAFNPGFLAVEISEIEVDIFAKSGYLTDRFVNFEVSSADIESTVSISDVERVRDESTVETVLLGTVTKLEPPLVFSGGFFDRKLDTEISELKLLNPGNYSEDSTSDKRWDIISKNPFDLIIKGVFKYKLPLSSATKSVVVNKVTFVDPNQDGGINV